MSQETPPPIHEWVEEPEPDLTIAEEENVEEVEITEEFPKGSWLSIDYLLRNPQSIIGYIKADHELWPISLTLLGYSFLLASFYGVIMGGTHLLMGSELPLMDKLLQAFVTSVKVPVLFLFTLFVVFPPIYVSNTFIGSRNSLRQVTAMLSAATASSLTVLASMGTVALFFSLTTLNYDFLKLLHVVFFGYAGVVGVGFLHRCSKSISNGNGVIGSGQLLFGWLVLYGFVGTQLAWVLRPFLGNPELSFQLFRERGGNFYESVFNSLEKFLVGLG